MTYGRSGVILLRLIAALPDGGPEAAIQHFAHRRQRRSFTLIVTVTLNTAVDKTYTIPAFTLDRVHRPTDWRIVPGGKGINVSRVLRTLGLDTLALGFAGGHNGGYIREGLVAEGIPHELVSTREESRVCITVIDPDNGTQTEINENGPTISQSEFWEFDSLLKSHLAGAEALVLSGSIPPGIPDDVYARWITAAREAGVWVLLDSSGAAMSSGMKACPDAAKPNRREFAELIGEDPFTADEIAERAGRFVDDGIDTMLVSMGRAGALGLTREEGFVSRSPDIDFVSAVGSGDAFVAGFLFARHHGYALGEALRYGTAAGAANAMSYGAGFCSGECIRTLAQQVEIQRITRKESSQ